MALLGRLGLQPFFCRSFLFGTKIWSLATPVPASHICCIAEFHDSSALSPLFFRVTASAGWEGRDVIFTLTLLCLTGITWMHSCVLRAAGISCYHRVINSSLRSLPHQEPLPEASQHPGGMVQSQAPGRQSHGWRPPQIPCRAPFWLSLSPSVSQAFSNGVLFETLSVPSDNRELWETPRQWLKSDISQPECNPVFWGLFLSSAWMFVTLLLPDILD